MHDARCGSIDDKQRTGWRPCKKIFISLSRNSGTGHTVETPDIASSFEPGPAPAGQTGPAAVEQTGPVFPDYTQQGMYDEIPLPSAMGGPGYSTGPTYVQAPVEGALPTTDGSPAACSPTSPAP